MLERSKTHCSSKMTKVFNVLDSNRSNICGIKGIKFFKVFLNTFNTIIKQGSCKIFCWYGIFLSTTIQQSKL